MKNIITLTFVIILSQSLFASDVKSSKNTTKRSPASEAAWAGSESVCSIKFKSGKKGSYCVGVISEEEEPKQAYCEPVHGTCPDVDTCLNDYHNPKNIPRNARIKAALEAGDPCQSNLIGH